MYLAIYDKSTALKIKRSDSDSTYYIDTPAQLIDATGATICSVTVNNNITTTTTSTASSQGDNVLYLSSVSGFTIGDYIEVTDANNRTQQTKVSGVNTSDNSIILSEYLLYDIEAGSNVNNLTTSLIFTVPSTTAYKAGNIVCTSSATEFQIEVVFVKRKLTNPVDTSSLITRYPRLTNIQPYGNSGFEGIINDAFDSLREHFWLNGYRLDHVKNSTYLKELIFAKIAELLTYAGYDLTGVGDTQDMLRTVTKKVSDEYNNLVNSKNLWIDTNNDDIQSDSEAKPLTTFRWDR